MSAYGVRSGLDPGDQGLHAVLDDELNGAGVDAPGPAAERVRDRMGLPGPGTRSQCPLLLSSAMSARLQSRSPSSSLNPVPVSRRGTTRARGELREERGAVAGVERGGAEPLQVLAGPPELGSLALEVEAADDSRDPIVSAAPRRP